MKACKLLEKEMWSPLLNGKAITTFEKGPTAWSPPPGPERIARDLPKPNLLVAPDKSRAVQGIGGEKVKLRMEGDGG